MTSDGQLSVIISSYRRLLSTTGVRAQALCLLSRLGQLDPGAKAARGPEETGGREAGAADARGETGRLDGEHQRTRTGETRTVFFRVVSNT